MVISAMKEELDDLERRTKIDLLLLQYKAMREAIAKEVNELEGLLAELTKPLKALETEIKERVVSYGQSVSAAGVKATYRRGYARVKWDSKALDGYMAAHPELERFRSESQVKASVSLKVTE